jgi:hypothetical protein
LKLRKTRTNSGKNSSPNFFRINHFRKSSIYTKSIKLSMVKTLLIVALVLEAGVINAIPDFIKRLPNGANVPGVKSVGHLDTEGGGPPNAFGVDFKAAGLSWTKELCEKDSDGDGQTNGQELGDPCCVWSPNSTVTVAYTQGVSHPGDKSKTADPSLWANISCEEVTTSGSGSWGNSAGSDKNSTEMSDDKASVDKNSTETSDDKTSVASSNVKLGFGLITAMIGASVFFL